MIVSGQRMLNGLTTCCRHGRGIRERQVNAMHKQRTTGFTLVEIAVVIIILVILVAIILPVFASVERSNNQHTCANNLQNMGVLLAQYRQDYGVYPAAPLSAYLRTLNPVSLPFSNAATQFSPTVFTGNDPLNDCAVSGSYNGASALNYVIKIDTVSGVGRYLLLVGERRERWVGQRHRDHREPGSAAVVEQRPGGDLHRHRRASNGR